MSTEQITVRLPTEMVEALREGAKAARRSVAAEIAYMLDRSPLGTPEPARSEPVNAADDPEPIEERTVDPDPDHLEHENRPVSFDHQPMGLKTKGKKG